MEREETDSDGKRSEERKVGPDRNQKKSNECVDGDDAAGHAQQNVLPFCFMKIWPKDADPNFIIQDAVRMFEEMDQTHFQISQQIREKVYEREEAISRLRDLKNHYIYRFNESVDRKKELFAHLCTSRYSLSLPKSCSYEEKLEHHKLNFQMLHKSKNVAQERRLLREINVRQQRDNSSTSPLMQGKYQNYSGGYKQRSCDNFLQRMKQSEVTGKISQGSRKSITNQIKIVGDELMEMRKEKRTLETKMKHAQKELESINEAIWSFQKHLKEKHHRKEASLFFLRETKPDYQYWILRHGNLENQSLFSNSIFQKNCK